MSNYYRMAVLKELTPKLYELNRFIVENKNLLEKYSYTRHLIENEISKLNTKLLKFDKEN